MKLPKTAHADRPWRIHEVAPDFHLEDVWALPTPGGPDDLRRAPRGPDFGPFKSVFLLDDEWAAELANETVHGILHLGWVEADGGYRGQLAVLVKPNGLLGAAYMAAIKPLRYAFVYPALLRLMERDWHRTPLG